VFEQDVLIIYQIVKPLNWFRP